MKTKIIINYITEIRWALVAIIAIRRYIEIQRVIVIHKISDYFELIKLKIRMILNHWQKNNGYLKLV